MTDDQRVFGELSRARRIQGLIDLALTLAQEGFVHVAALPYETLQANLYIDSLISADMTNHLNDMYLRILSGRQPES